MENKKVIGLLIGFVLILGAFSAYYFARNIFLTIIFVVFFIIDGILFKLIQTFPINLP